MASGRQEEECERDMVLYLLGVVARRTVSDW